MSEPLLVSVGEITGCPYAVAVSDGDRVREQIVPALRTGRQVTLSFRGIELVVPAFLSAAIGQLYKEFPEPQVDSLVFMRDLPEGAQTTVDCSRRWAKAFHRNPDAYRRAIQEVLDE